MKPDPEGTRARKKAAGTSYSRGIGRNGRGHKGIAAQITHPLVNWLRYRSNGKVEANFWKKRVVANIRAVCPISKKKRTLSKKIFRPLNERGSGRGRRSRIHPAFFVLSYVRKDSQQHENSISEKNDPPGQVLERLAVCGQEGEYKQKTDRTSCQSRGSMTR